MPSFPKSARLLKKTDFRFKPFKKYFSERFSFYYSPEGAGRIGISISKKVLKKATDRNRLKRLLRESFRELRGQINKVDLHIVAKEGDLSRWDGLKKQDIDEELKSWMDEAFKKHS